MLDNLYYTTRPTALKLLELIADVFVEEDPHGGEVDLVKLINIADENARQCVASTIMDNEDFMKHRVMEIKVIFFSLAVQS